MITRVYRLCLSLTLIATPCLAQRLPDNVVPSHYEIAVTPDLQAATFTGTETIAATLKKAATIITLNAAEIQFDTVTVKSGGRSEQARVSLDPAKEQATFTVDREIPAGLVQINLQYRGILNDQLRGLYLSRANNRRYAVTQLEATDARRMFPSFDEPAYKATFTLTATIDQADHAISNGAVVTDTPGPGPGKHTIKFETTPRMSTYLVALAVGDFECQSGSADGTPIRICSTPDKKGQTAIALEAAETILRYYNKYYAVKYPFKKLDVVAVPDFAAGAMENTAAIFYRETLLLADPKTASQRARKDIAEVLAHEMAHQWFGDLVTMRWWDDIWLNEGFANWMETKPLKAWKPEWHMELSEVQSNQSAMTLDSLKTTRPIRAEAWTPAEIGELFDQIAYEKGAAVLRMVEAWVGEDAFRAGVNAYIERFKYSNARAEDFWGTLTRVTGKPVDRVMSGFVDRPGVPTIEPSVTCSGSRGSVSLAQGAPAGAAPAASSAGASGTWTIPACVKTPAQGAACAEVASAPAVVPTASCPAWVMSNAGGRGYYRVVNSPDMVRALARAVEGLAPAERIALLSDEWALVRAGQHDVGTFMDLADGFKNERTPEVLETLLGTLGRISEALTTDASRARYRGWVISLLKPAMQEIGWTSRPDDTEERQSVRAALVSALGEIGRDPETIQTARRMIDANDPIDPTLLNAIVHVAALSGDRALYDKYLARSKQASSPEEHYRYLYALASFTDPELVRRTMDLIAGPDVRSQDTSLFLARLLDNPEARPLAWQLLQSRWDDLQKKAGQVFGSPLLIGSLGQFCDAKRRSEVEEFFRTHKVAEAERTLQQALERISTCAQLAEAQAPKLEAWLQNR